MNKSITFSVCLLLFSLSIWSPGCTEKTEIPFPFTPEAACGKVVTLSSQSDIDQFDQAEVKGDLIISGDNITNLDGLNKLSYICGNFEIMFCPNLSSLSGLNINLTVGGHFFLTGNTTLIDFRGFPNNFSLNGRLKIQSNLSLLSLNGFSSEISLTKLELIDNKNLETLTGVPDHIDIFYLESSPKIISLNGLTPGFNCTEFSVAQCESLKNLQGFPISLPSLMVLRLIDNPNLEDISGLSNLRFVRRELIIEGNPQLSDCCTLRPLIDNFGIIPFKTEFRANHPDCNPATILENGPC